MQCDCSAATFREGHFKECTRIEVDGEIPWNLKPTRVQYSVQLFHYVTLGLEGKFGKYEH